MELRKKMYIILSCIVLVLGVFGFSYYTTLRNMIDETPKEKSGMIINARDDISPIVNDEEEGVSNFPLEERVSPTTILIERIESINTGKSIEYKQEAPEEIVNFTGDEVIDYYKDYDSVKFTDNMIVIVKKTPYLPNHFIVKLEEDYIKVYTTDLDGKAVIYKDFAQIPCKNRDSELERGIEVESLDEVWQRIGDYE